MGGGSKVSYLNKLIRSAMAAKANPNLASPPPPPPPPTPAADDILLNHIISSLLIETPPSSSSSHVAVGESPKRSITSESVGKLSNCYYLCPKNGDAILDLGVAPDISNGGDRFKNVSLSWREIAHEWKKELINKRKQTNRFNRLVKMSVQKLGADATIDVLGKLRRETRPKELGADATIDVLDKLGLETGPKE